MRKIPNLWLIWRVELLISEKSVTIHHPTPSNVKEGLSLKVTATKAWNLALCTNEVGIDFVSDWGG